MTIFPIQSSYARGELSPRLHGRIDIDHYQMGLAMARNWIVMRQGGITRRPGTVYIAGVKTQSAAVRLMRFEFSETQAYCLEFGNLYIRFYTNGGQVQSGGSPYEVVTPYVTADLSGLQYTQSGDTLYIVHEDYAPRKLVRTTETSWTLSEITFEDGPYLEEETEGTLLTPAATGAVHPIMTSNTLPSGTASDSASSTEAWEVFDTDPLTELTLVGASGNVAYDFASTDTKIANSYWLQASSESANVQYTPTAWAFEGYDGSTWITIDSRDGETGWRVAEKRYFEFPNETAYQSYRFRWTANDGSNNNSVIARLFIGEEGDSQTAFNLTASATTGINGGTGFLSTDVGRSIRLYGSDGRWRWARIAAYTSSTVVTIRLYGYALPDLSPITRWQMSAWSTETGYPASTAFYEERFATAGSTTEPAKAWLTKSQDFDNFGTSTPLVANDGVAAEMTGGRLNRIAWIEELGDLIVATGGSMRVIGQSDTADPFGATNVRQKQQNTYGAAAIQPVVVGNRLLYVDRFRRRVMEMGYDFQANGYASQERSILSDHLFIPGITELTFQQDPNDILWVPTVDGKLIACTYVPVQDVYGFTPQRIGGTFSGSDWGIVESAVSIPSTTGDVLYLVVKRTINGSTTRYVEYMSPFHEIGDAVEDGVFFDSAITYSGSAAASISGVSHLEGATVGILADGVDLGDATVASGVVTLPDSITAEKITVGLRYTSRAETLRATQVGQKDGTALGRRMHVSGLYVDIMETAGLKAGSMQSQKDVVGRQYSEALDSAITLRTGIYEVPGVVDKTSNHGVAVFTTDKGYPATIRASVLQIEGEP